MVREAFEKKQPFREYPEGEYVFEIYDVGEAEPTEKTTFRWWTLNFFAEGETQRLRLRMPVWKYADILISVGCKTVDGAIDWEPAQIVGKRFKANLTYREWDGKRYPNLEYAHSDGAIKDDSNDIPF
jgi:hypothetical protein